MKRSGGGLARVALCLVCVLSIHPKVKAFELQHAARLSSSDTPASLLQAATSPADSAAEEEPEVSTVRGVSRSETESKTEITPEASVRETKKDADTLHASVEVPKALESVSDAPADRDSVIDLNHQTVSRLEGTPQGEESERENLGALRDSASPTSPSGQNTIPEDALATLFGEDTTIQPLAPAVETLRSHIDSDISKVEQHVMQEAMQREQKSPDLLEASMTLGKLARGLDWGVETPAAEKTARGSKLLDSSLADEGAPEALRALLTLEEQGLLGDHLLRLWQAHQRLGLGLRDAMSSFLSSVEREKALTAATAAALGVYKVREGVEGAKEKRTKTAEATAELVMLRKLHKYLGKHGKQLRKKLVKVQDPQALADELEDMWEPVDAVSAFDPARGSGLYHAVKVLGQDLDNTQSTCFKLKMLVTHLAEEEALASKQQLAKEAREEQELQGVVDPEMGPLAALSPSSLSTLAKTNPKALQEADRDFMLADLDKDAASDNTARTLLSLRPRPQFLPRNDGLRRGPSRLLARTETVSRSLTQRGDLAAQPRADETLAIDSTDMLFPLVLGSRTLPRQALQTMPSVIYDGVLDPPLPALSLTSFLELKAEATPLSQEPQGNARLANVGPHSSEGPQGKRGPFAASLLSLGASNEGEKDDEEGESRGAEKDSSGETVGEEGSAGASAGDNNHGDSSQQQQQEDAATASKQQSEPEEGLTEAPEAEGSASEKASASQTQRAAQNTAAPEADTAAEQPAITMLGELEPNSCEVITDPAACMQKEGCFQDFLYGACFFNCTTVETPEDCSKHKFCRYEEHVPHRACVNEGRQAVCLSLLAAAEPQAGAVPLSPRRFEEALECLHRAAEHL